MKSMNENQNNSWLGFSLSPHMKMEVSSSDSHQQNHNSTHDDEYHHHHHHHGPSSFYLSPHYSNNSEIFYGENNAALHHSAASSLSVMPLKSDGSLCIMEALNRSQTEGMVSSSSPKLEDFLGCATMAYNGSQEKSGYFNQNAESKSDRSHSLDTHHQNQILIPTTHHNNHNQYYSGLIPSCNDPQIPQMAREDDEIQMPCFRNWVSRTHYATQNTLEQHINVAGAGAGGVTLVNDGGGSGSIGELQSLSLSMSPGSQSSSFTPPGQISSPVETKKRGPGKLCPKQPVHRKSIDTFGQRTSQYRGVTRHRWTGRYEAHLWDNSCKKEGQTRKGRQVYLGGYDMEEKAARAYDLAALKYWGPSTHINFPLENYQTEIEEMKNMSRQEYVAHLRRKSSGFSRGASIFRGVTRHHQHGRWQARIGRVAGNKDLYLGTFSTQEEAAEAYDIAAIKFRGVNAVTNFDISRYDVERIIASNTLLAGELARRNKDNEPPPPPSPPPPPPLPTTNDNVIGYDNNNGGGFNNDNNNSCDWKMSSYNNQNSSVTATFSMALQDLIGMESLNSNGHDEVVTCKQVTSHFSNSSVTSLSSSRECSPPDKNISMHMPFGKPPPPPPPEVVGSWSYPLPPQMRPTVAIPMAHLPVFAAWNDT